MSPRKFRRKVSMRTPEPDEGRVRAGDLGRRAWLRAWWTDGGKELVVGVMALTACIGMFTLGFFTWQASEQRAKDQAIVRVIAQEQLKITRAQAKKETETARLTRDQCVRSKALGPSLANDYEIRKVLTGEKLDLYRSLIPKTCPAAPKSP